MQREEIDRLFRGHVREHFETKSDPNDLLKKVRPLLYPMAGALLQRWAPSAAVGVEDVVQELMVGILWALKRYDPARGELARYVVYNAHDKAKKWLHKQRGANLHGNADANRSRLPRYFEDIKLQRQRKAGAIDLGIEVYIPAMQVEPTQDDTIESHETWRGILRKAPNGKLRYALLALQHARGERALAANMLYADVKVRLYLRLGCEADAHRIVKKASRYLAAA